MCQITGLEKAQCSNVDLERARSMVPKALESYVTGMLWYFSYLWVMIDKLLMTIMIVANEVFHVFNFIFIAFN